MRDLTLGSKRNGDECIFTIFDFAGQKEYTHTHQLFFDKDALFLVVYYPDSDGEKDKELEDFISKINNCLKATASSSNHSSEAVAAHSSSKTNTNTIIFAASHCDDYRKGQILAESQRVFLKKLFTSKSFNPIKAEVKAALEEKRKFLFKDGLDKRVYKDTLYFDSKSGSGIDDLKQTLVELAWSDPDKAKMVPDRWMKLLDEIRSMSENERVFSLLEDDLINVTTGRLPDLSKENAKSAISMFLSWGLLYELSNGHLVLQPQKLANVLACVFTADAKSSLNGMYGYISHNDTVMKSIWGRQNQEEGSKTSATIKPYGGEGSSSSGSSSISNSNTGNSMHTFKTTTSKCFDKEHWEFKALANGQIHIPPFLQLLYDSGLAYPIVDPKTMKPIGESLVPALLIPWPRYEKGDKIKSNFSENGELLPGKVVLAHEDRTYDIISDDSGIRKNRVHESIIRSRSDVEKIAWDEAGNCDSKFCQKYIPLDWKRDKLELVCTSTSKWGIPESFFSRLHVKLSTYCAKEPSWRQGFVVKITDFNNIQSVAIVFISYLKQTIYIVSGSENGLVTAARCRVILAIKDLRTKEFKNLDLTELETVHIRNAEFDLLLAETKIDMNKMPESIQNLHICLSNYSNRSRSSPQQGLDGVAAVAAVRGGGGGGGVSNEGAATTATTTTATTNATTTTAAATTTATANLTPRETQDGLLVYLDDAILNAIPDILDMQGISRDNDPRDQLSKSCLWVLLQHKTSNEVFAFPIVPQISTHYSRDPWWFYEDAKVAIPITSLSSFDEELDNEASGVDVRDKVGGASSPCSSLGFGSGREGGEEGEGGNDAGGYGLGGGRGGGFGDDDNGGSSTGTGPSVSSSSSSSSAAAAAAVKDVRKSKLLVAKALYIILDHLFRELKITLPPDYVLSSIPFIKSDTIFPEQIIRKDKDPAFFVYNVDRKVAKVALQTYNEALVARNQLVFHEIAQNQILIHGIVTDQNIQLRAMDHNGELRHEMSMVRLEGANNMLETLLYDMHRDPVDFVFVPACEGGFMKYLSLPFSRTYRLFFICNHTKRLVNCGPKRNGFKIKLHREWVKRALPFLKITYVLASITVNLLVPGLLKVNLTDFLPETSHIDEVAEQFTGNFIKNYKHGNILRKVDDDVQKSIKKIKNVIKSKVKTELKGDNTRTASTAAAADDDVDDDEQVELTSLSMSGYWGIDDKKEYDERQEFLSKELAKKYGDKWSSNLNLVKIVRGANTDIKPSTKLGPSRLKATAWVFKHQDVIDSFHFSDEPSKEAMEAISKALNDNGDDDDDDDGDDDDDFKDCWFG